MDTEQRVNIDEAEWAANEEAAENSKSHVTIRLPKPLEWEGNTYNELTFDFESLTGKDSMDIEKEMRAKNIPLITPAFSGDYLIRAAVRACTAEIGMDALLTLPLPVYNRIRTTTSAFLARWEI
jgi:hypothetical protein